jgi:hypothetical protein
VAGLFAPDLLRRLGCEVVELYCESDGRFPNHLPDPEMEENVRDLQARVVEVGADLGIAYDGDADRMGVVDEKGQRYEADFVLILLARDLLTRHPGATVIFDVKCSQNVVDDIRAHGGVPKMWKTGHSLLKRKMREEGILLGGEVSGHMFFAEGFYGIDDGIYASAKLIEIASSGPDPLSAHFGTIPHLHVTPELKAPCPDDKKFQVVAEIANEFKGRYETIDIDGARVVFPDGWGLVRASNTNPYLTLRFEAKTEAQLEEIKRIYSHPHALGQCKLWLEKHLPKIPAIETYSTAKAAEVCLEDPTAAAIASELAARVYGLQVVKRRIEDNMHNFTRFLIISRTSPERTGRDKTSVMFSVKDRPGALYDLLRPFAMRGMNLTKIESRPSRRKAWEYLFFVDLEGHVNDDRVKATVEEVNRQCLFIKILGSYPACA